MSYYPLFDILENRGFVNIPNFPPNNWESTSLGTKKIYQIRTDGNNWLVNEMGDIKENTFSYYDTNNIEALTQLNNDRASTGELALFLLRNNPLDQVLGELPGTDVPGTYWPDWRATIGFKSETSVVSYQGEINPTPPTATLLTFHPFIQFDNTNNYFVFINIENKPGLRWSEMEIYLAESKKRIDSVKIRNNAVNVIPLDHYGFEPDDLPVFYCRTMAGIPFGFGKSLDSGMLSLEHTHPPGSFTLLGNRLNAQKNIKVGWSKLLDLHNKPEIVQIV